MWAQQFGFHDGIDNMSVKLQGIIRRTDDVPNSAEFCRFMEQMMWQIVLSFVDLCRHKS